MISKQSLLHICLITGGRSVHYFNAHFQPFEVCQMIGHAGKTFYKHSNSVLEIFAIHSIQFPSILFYQYFLILALLLDLNSFLPKNKMHTIENPPIPFTYPINGGMQTGSELIFQGATYNGQQKRFHINLLGQGDDVVLHFNPRFKFFEDTIVLNSKTYSGWGTEVRHRNRMNVGDSFRIRLVCHHSHFLILVNEKEVGNYEHRLSPQMVRSLEIGGDVMMHRVQMINFPQAQAPQPLYPSAPPQPYAPPPAHYPSLGLGPTQNSYPPPQPEYGFNSSGPVQNHPSPHHHHYH